MRDYIRSKIEKWALKKIVDSKLALESGTASGDGSTYKYVNIADGYLHRYMRQGRDYRILRWRPPFNIYIHRFCKSDDIIPHDHPFYFFTYIVKGSYQEIKWDPDFENKGLLTPSIKHREQGTLAFRKPTDLHTVQLYNQLLDDPPLSEDDGVLTICVTWRIPRIWGFVTPHRNETGEIVGHIWTNWFEHTGIEPNSDQHEGSE
jgi:hypothetical protein